MWAAEGSLVPARTLAEVWGLTPHLGPAEVRGEIFSIPVKNVRHYPVEFLHLDRETIATVCQALGDLSRGGKARVLEASTRSQAGSHHSN